MKTTKRFEAAVQKLYAAFHDDKLDPNCCRQCAVGNILDNSDAWKHLSDDHGSLRLNYVGKVHQSLGRRFNGYTPLELLQIEQAFLQGCGFEVPFKPNSKKPKQCNRNDYLFDGFSKVVQFLCKLDSLDNVMDYRIVLRDTLKKQPSYALK